MVFRLRGKMNAIAVTNLGSAFSDSEDFDRRFRSACERLFQHQQKQPLVSSGCYNAWRSRSLLVSSLKSEAEKQRI
jgi:hypothetical protein